MKQQEFQQKLKAAIGNPNTELIRHLTKYNEEVRKAWLPIWTRNGARSYQAVEKHFLEYDADIHSIPKVEKEPMLIIGSGPSLDDWHDYIKEWKHGILCSTSQLAWLEYHGVKPTYVHLIDADPVMVYLMKQSKYRKTVPLLTHPQVPREAIEAWKAKVYYYRMHDPASDLQTTYIPWMYGLVNTDEDKRWHVHSHIMNLGNVMNASISIAQNRGYSPIYIAGYDLGYPEGQYRFTNYEKDKETKEWKAIPDTGIPEGREGVGLHPGHNGVLCDDLGSFYKYSFMIMWGLGAPPLLNTSRGIIDEMPYVHPKEVVEADGRLDDLLPTPWEQYKIAQEYLRVRGVYILKNMREISVRNRDEIKWWRWPFFWLNWNREKNSDLGWPEDQVEKVFARDRT